MTEGCLSMPGIFEKVLRYPEVVVSFLNGRAEPQLVQFDGLEAHCAQHEMDHQEGQLFTNKFGPVKRDLLKRKMQKRLKKDRK
jgi:peptide deformylase